MARTVCSAVMTAGSKKALVMKAKMMSKHISMKKFSRPGKAAKKPAAIPETVVMVVSKMVWPVSSMADASPLGDSPSSRIRCMT